MDQLLARAAHSGSKRCSLDCQNPTSYPAEFTPLTAEKPKREPHRDCKPCQKKATAIAEKDTLSLDSHRCARKLRARRAAGEEGEFVGKFRVDLLVALLYE